ncbi:MAG: hypothetical protein J2P36_21190 [Ktedonobacteraceae bacterium]|nr:hypothetical protein [Ktedonobacteraceae bacterium]
MEAIYLLFSLLILLRKCVKRRRAVDKKEEEGEALHVSVVKNDKAIHLANLRSV